MADLLIDTDVLIDHLRGDRRFRPGTDRVEASVITRRELFVGTGADDAPVRTLLEALHELPVDGVIAERAGRIRRVHGTRIVDALIAATALEHGLTLVTRNGGDFAGIRQLRVRAPR